MSGPAIDLDAYLTRVGLPAPPPLTAGGLERVTRAQAYSVPFENFDILLGRGIRIDAASISKKILHCPRGGYCFELNQLLFLALQGFGFHARQAVARVHIRGEPTGYTHLLSLVRVDGEDWIADVGFGASSLRAPMRFAVGTVSDQDGYAYRLAEAPPYGFMLQLRDAGEWKNLYSFEDRLALPIDLELGNHFVSTHPRSFFTWMKTATLPNPRGRAALRDGVLTIEREGTKTEHPEPKGEAFTRALKEHFGIVLDAPYAALKPLNPPPRV